MRAPQNFHHDRQIQILRLRPTHQLNQHHVAPNRAAEFREFRRLQGLQEIAETFRVAHFFRHEQGKFLHGNRVQNFLEQRRHSSRSLRVILFDEFRKSSPKRAQLFSPALDVEAVVAQELKEMFKLGDLSQFAGDQFPRVVDEGNGVAGFVVVRRVFFDDLADLVDGDEGYNVEQVIVQGTGSSFSDAGVMVPSIAGAICKVTLGGAAGMNLAVSTESKTIG